MPFKFKVKTGTGTPVSGALDVGEFGYDTASERLFIGNGPSDFATAIGGELMTERVYNGTGSQLNKLAAVYVNGAQGQRITVALARANVESTSSKTLGLVSSAIANGDEGEVAVSGLLRGVNASGSQFSETWNQGDAIYLSPSTAGALTKVKPSAPNHMVLIGFVVNNSSTAGSIFVKVQNGFELEEIHNVAISGPDAGHILIYDNVAQVWENSTLTAGNAITITNGAGSISIAHSDTSSQNSVDNSGVDYIQDITLDTYGHVTAIGTTTIRDASDSVSGLVSTGTQTFSGDKTMTGILTISSTYPRINLTDTNHNSDYSIINNDGSLGFWDNTNSAYRMHILSSGNVGIGTINPGEKLSISSGNIKLYSLQNTADQYRYIGTEYDVANGNNKAEIRFAIDGADTRTRIQFHTANGVGNIDERMRITYTGSVGIGTTTPGTINGTAFAGVGLHNVFGTQGRLVTQGTGSAELLLNDSGATANQRIKHIISDGGVLHLGKTTDGGVVTNHLSILDNGNVGIGTTSPATKLHVIGNDATTAADFIALFHEPGITPEASSVVSTSADKAIMVQGNGGAFYIGRDVTNDIEFAMGSSALGEAFSGAMTGHKYSLRTSNTNRLTIDTNGNVGIGTTSPTNKLEVVGDTTLSNPGNANVGLSFTTGGVTTSLYKNDADDSLRYYSISAGTGADRLTILPSGNVGIGTSSPAKQLEIQTASGTESALRLRQLSQNFWDIRIPAGQTYLVINDVTAERLRIDANGLVGINEASPTAQLVVKSGATNRVPLIVDSLTGQTAELQSWRVNGSAKAYLSASGVLFPEGGISNFSTGSNALITLPSTGVTISRNIADTNPALIVNLANASATGDIARYQKAGATLVSIGNDGTITGTNLTLSGDLTINGTTTNINTTNLVVEDKNIILGDVTTPSDTTADGGGITLKGASDKTITWVDATDYWTSNQVFSAPNFVSTVATGTQPYATTSTTVNTNLNADLLDGQHGSYYAPIASPTFTGTVTYGDRLNGNTASTRDKIRLYNDSNYTIGFQSGITYGGLNNDWGITFQVNDDNDRGFWWGDATHSSAQGAMALTTNGLLTVASGIRLGYGESDTTIPSASVLDVSGSIKIDNLSFYDTDTVTTTSTTQTVLESFAAATYGVGKFLIQATQGTARQVSELLVTHDGTTAIATEYAVLKTGSTLFTTEVDISGGNVRVLVTTASATSTVYKTSFTLIGA